MSVEMIKKPWPPEEIARLRVMHASEMTTEQMGAELGRTANSVQTKMADLQLGVRSVARTKWSSEEDAALEELWAAHGSLKVLCAKHLPTRTVRAAQLRAPELGLAPREAKQRVASYSWVKEEVDRVLMAKPCLTVPEISELCAGSGNRITTLLRDGHGKGYWISGWHRDRSTGNGGWWPRWSLGNSTDAPRPAKQDTSLRMRNYRASKRVAAGQFDPFSTLVQQVAA